MSKSIGTTHFLCSKLQGNIIEPSVIIKGGKVNKQEIPPLGIDTLRMWITFSDFTQDLQLGPSVISFMFTLQSTNLK